MLINMLPKGYHNDMVYRGAAKWGETPEIQNKAQKIADKAMTDGFVKQIETHAKRDAKNGEYMSGQFIQMRLSYMKQHVSPDISGPVGQVSNLIQEAMHSYDPILSLLDTMLGEYSAEVRVTPTAQNATIYSPDGEMVASYNSLGGGWHIRQTTAEKKFLSEATTVYARAYKEARAEINAAAQAQAPPSEGTTVDMHV